MPSKKDSANFHKFHMALQGIRCMIKRRPVSKIDLFNYLTSDSIEEIIKYYDKTGHFRHHPDEERPLPPAILNVTFWPKEKSEYGKL